jgi:SdpC family antimicrobial peptide
MKQLAQQFVSAHKNDLPSVSDLKKQLESAGRAMSAQGDSRGATEAQRVARLLDRAPTPAEGIEDAVLSKIGQDDPSFFDRFGTMMQSEDQVQVAAALKEGSERFLDAYDALGFGQMIAPENRQVVVGPVAVACAAVLVAVAAAAVFVVYLGVVFLQYNYVYPDPTGAGNAGSLPSDMWVQRLTTTLGRK